MPILIGGPGPATSGVIDTLQGEHEMRTRSLGRLLAAALILTLPGGLTPVAAAEPRAGLTGSIVRAKNDAAIPGARLHAGDPRTGRVFSSSPAGDDGTFALGDLPPSTYRLAVEADDGL